VQPLKQARQHAASPEIGKTCSKSQEAIFFFSVSLHIKIVDKGSRQQKI